MSRPSYLYEYYPFGMVMQSIGSSRFGFNGMERDDEWSGSGNSYDFGARIYDSRLGRFSSVDPMINIQIEYSSYLYAGNKPIVAIDYAGALEVIVHEIFVGKHTRKIKIHESVHYDTYEEVLGVERTVMHIYVTKTSRRKTFCNSAATVVGSFDYYWVTNIDKEGGLDGAEKLKDEQPVVYYMFQFVANNPIGTGKIVGSGLDRDPLTNKEYTPEEKAGLLIGGVLDLVTLGRSGSATNFLTSYIKEQLGELLAEKLINLSFESLGLDQKQEGLLAFHIARFIHKGRKGDLENLANLTQEIIGLGLKGQAVVEKYRLAGLDLDQDLDANAVFEKISAEYKNGNNKENNRLTTFLKGLRQDHGTVTEIKDEKVD